MNDSTFIRVEEIAKDLDVSKASAYKLMRTLNNELTEKGFYTVRGRVSRQYYEERVYGAARKGA